MTPARGGRCDEESGHFLQLVVEELGVHANQLHGCRNEILKGAAAFFACEVVA